MEVDKEIYDLSNNDNDTIYDKFLFLIDQAVETGEPNIILKAVKDFRPYIGENYIKMAEQMYFSLIQEKLDNMEL